MTGRTVVRMAAALLAVVVLVAGCSGGDDDAAPATTRAAQPRTYVALGDSFSAGEGTLVYDESSGACRRSERAWPHVLDNRASGLVLRELRACGGATTARFLGPWPERDEPAQIPGSRDAEVGLVTFTIGGNDIGFADIVARCVLGDCADVPDSADFETTLAALSSKLVAEVYPALAQAFPRARLVHVGYPSLTPAVGEPVVDCPWLSELEQPATVAIAARLDEAIAAAAQESTRAGVGVSFVDAGDALAGHELCSATPWVNSVFSPGSERAHPTADGHGALAAAVLDALPDALVGPSPAGDG